MQTKNQRGNEMPKPAADQELEKYGVWVKAEPQDITEESETEHEILAAEEPEQALSADLSADDFDIPELDEDFSLEISEGKATSEEESILDIETLGEESVSFSMEGFDDGLDEDVIEDSVIEIPLDDLDSLEQQAEDKAADFKADHEAPALAEEAAPARQKEESGDLDTTEISLEDFGFSIDEEPAPSSQAGIADASSAPSAEPESVDLSAFGLDEEETAPLDTVAEEEFESLDIDLQFDDTIPSPQEEEQESVEFSLDDIESTDEFDSIPSPDAAMEDVTADFESISSAKGLDLPEPEPVETGSASRGVDSFIDEEVEESEGLLPELREESVRFDDLKALESELGEMQDTRVSHDAAASDLLKTIAGELAAIKDELVSLRSQFSTLKASQALDTQQETIDTGHEEAQNAAGGFFDEEEDDTIALTGDELDNILNTADFTEEAVPEEGIGADEGVSLDLLPENGEYSTELAEPAIEEGHADIELIAEDEELLSLGNEEQIEEDHVLTGEVEVAPLLTLDEDTSYLEEEDESLSILAEDLVEAPLVEPAEDELVIEAETDQDIEAFELTEEEASGDEELVLSIEAEEPLPADEESFAVGSIEEIEEELSELEDLGAEEAEFDVELHTEELHADKEESFEVEGLDEESGIIELEELEELEADIPSVDFSSMEENIVKPAEPVDIHPDEISMSLDDSFFVNEPEEKQLDLSSPDNIRMPSFGTDIAARGEPEGIESLEEELEPIALEEQEELDRKSVV